MPKKKSNSGFTRYTSYNFVDRDPVFDVLRTMKADSKMTNKAIHEKSNVSTGTLRDWDNGKRKRPMFATAAAVAAAMGYDSIPITSEARKKIRK